MVVVRVMYISGPCSEARAKSHQVLNLTIDIDYCFALSGSIIVLGLVENSPFNYICIRIQ